MRWISRLRRDAPETVPSARKRWTRTNPYGHELLVRREAVDLTAISPPARLVPACRGDGPAAGQSGKGLNMDFKTAGLVRGVRHQPAIGRKAAVPLITRRSQKTHRLQVPRYRCQPKIGIRRRGRREEQMPTIRRPIQEARGWTRDSRRASPSATAQALPAAATGALGIELSRSTGPGCPEHDPCPVGRPGWRGIQCRPERERR